MRGARGLYAASLLVGLGLACSSQGTLLVRGNGGGGGAANAAAGLDAGGSAGNTGGAGTTAPYSPAPQLTWQAQLQGEFDTTLPVELFYLDADDVGEATLRELLGQGKHVLCYLSAGTFEPWRADAADFPAGALGGALPDASKERWLDFRDDRVRSLMQKRVRSLSTAGCEGVDPSTLDAYLNDTGFDISRADTLDYARWLSAQIHAQGMSAGLSAPEELIDDLSAAFDWALAVDCLKGTGCAGYLPLREQGKTVLLVEFGDESDADTVCPRAAALGFDALLKNKTFDAFRFGCQDAP